MNNSERTIKLGLNSLISTASALAILIMVNHISSRHYMRMDWTMSRMFTLSDKTETVVKGLKEDVTLYVLLSGTNPLFGQIEQMLENYKSLSDRIEVNFLDPDEDPEQFMMIQNRYGKFRVDEHGQAGVEAGIFAVSGSNVKFLSADGFQDIQSDLGMPTEEAKISFKAEGMLTSAILALTCSEKKKICFTQGHGEWSFEGAGRDSLRHIKRELSLDGFQTMGFSIKEEGHIPKECDAVVAAGPKRAFMATEAEHLRKYFNKGGRVMLLLDPIMEKDRFAPCGLERLTRKNGIELESDLIIETDPRRLVSETPVTFMANRFFAHKAVKSLSNIKGGPPPVLFSVARSLRQVEGENVVSDILAKTSELSYGEVDLASINVGSPAPEQDQFDTEGPLTIAMAAVRGTTDGKEAGRIVVVGDSDFLSEELFINASLYNQDFWSSLTGWLTETEELISILPKDQKQVNLQLSDSDLGNIVILLILEVFLIAAIGVFVIRRRKR